MLVIESGLQSAKIVLKTNPWTCKFKNSNEETTIGSFCEKELLLSKL